MPRPTFSADELYDSLRAGDRGMLSRAITLIESTRAADRDLAQHVLERIAPDTGASVRLGISGVPGVGKSTFIEALGGHILDSGNTRLAILAVDPSSSRTGGSILGDKTRMQSLSEHADAYIRPSPSVGALGGVTRVTRETMMLCEAAGYNVVLVETVGVGQSEIAVASMVDFFLVLMLPGAGDDLQGIKKGVLEVADQITINKADGERKLAADAAAAAYARALSIVTPTNPNWTPPVSVCSALHGTGIDAIWSTVLRYQTEMLANGGWFEKRQQQQVAWMWSLIDWQLQQQFKTNPQVQARLQALQDQVADGTLTPGKAAATLIGLM